MKYFNDLLHDSWNFYNSYMYESEIVGVICKLVQLASRRFIKYISFEQPTFKMFL